MFTIRLLLRVLFLLTGIAFAASACTTQGQPMMALESARDMAGSTRFQGDVYILRGGAGVFSVGLVKLSDQLKQNGVQSTLLSHAAWQLAEQRIVENRRKYGRVPVVIIGHSLGGTNAILLAKALKKRGIDVDLIVSYAATASMEVPSNVHNVTNYYFKSGGWGGVFTPGSGFSGNLVNKDMSVVSGMTHFNVDDDPGLRNEVVANVLRYVRPQEPAAAR